MTTVTTVWKINSMESRKGGLEDDFPFQLGDFEVPAVDFPGCTCQWLILKANQA